MATQVLNGVVDVTNTVISYERNHQLCAGIGSLTLQVKLQSIGLFSLSDTITIYEEGSKKGEYLVYDITKQADTGMATVSGQDDSKLLSDYFIPTQEETQLGQTTRYWIERMFSDTGVSYNFLSSDQGIQVAKSTIGFQTAFEVITRMAQQSGWTFWFDKDNVCQIGTLTTGLSSYKEVFTESEILTISKVDDSDPLRNRAIVWGSYDFSTLSPIYSSRTRRTQWDIDENDIRAMVLSNQYIESRTSADYFVDRLLDENARLRSEIVLTVKDHYNIFVNDLIFVKSRLYTGIARIIDLTATVDTTGGRRTTLIINKRCGRTFNVWNAEDYVYIGTVGEGVWRKPLPLGSWEAYNQGIEITHTNDLFVNDGNFACVTASGFPYYRTITDSSWSAMEVPTFIRPSGSTTPLIFPAEVKAIKCTMDKLTNDISVVFNTTNITGINDLASWIGEYNGTSLLSLSLVTISGSEGEINNHRLFDAEHNSKELIMTGGYGVAISGCDETTGEFTQCMWTNRLTGEYQADFLASNDSSTASVGDHRGMSFTNNGDTFDPISSTFVSSTSQYCSPIIIKNMVYACNKLGIFGRRINQDTSSESHIIIFPADLIGDPGHLHYVDDETFYVLTQELTLTAGQVSQTYRRYSVDDSGGSPVVTLEDTFVDSHISKDMATGFSGGYGVYGAMYSSGVFGYTHASTVNMVTGDRSLSIQDMNFSSSIHTGQHGITIGGFTGKAGTIGEISGGTYTILLAVFDLEAGGVIFTTDLTFSEVPSGYTSAVHRIHSVSDGGIDENFEPIIVFNLVRELRQSGTPFHVGKTAFYGSSIIEKDVIKEEPADLPYTANGATSVPAYITIAGAVSAVVPYTPLGTSRFGTQKYTTTEYDGTGALVSSRFGDYTSTPASPGDSFTFNDINGIRSQSDEHRQEFYSRNANTGKIEARSYLTGNTVGTKNFSFSVPFSSIRKVIMGLGILVIYYKSGSNFSVRSYFFDLSDYPDILPVQGGGISLSGLIYSFVDGETTALQTLPRTADVEISKGIPTLIPSRTDTPGDNIYKSYTNASNSFVTASSNFTPFPLVEIRDTRNLHVDYAAQITVVSGVIDTETYQDYVFYVADSPTIHGLYGVIEAYSSGVADEEFLLFTPPSGKAYRLETSNYYNPLQYIFVSTSGNPSQFYQSNPSGVSISGIGFFDQSTNIPTGNITIIRMDDIL